MDFLDKSIEKYAESLSDSESELLAEIHKYTLSKVHQPRMISGHLQGRFLSFVSRMVKPENILEIGTYTGYSALCLAEGLRKKGRLITIDRDKSLKEKVSKFFNKSIFKNQIDQKLGNAIDIIPKLIYFDLIFIDADKKTIKLF